MNKELRKAIYNTQMLRNKYEKYQFIVQQEMVLKRELLWERYRP
jgi:hypothetical protein